MSTTNSACEQSAHFEGVHAKVSEISAKLNELESVVSKEVVKFAEYTVSSALLALSSGPAKTLNSKQPEAASSEKSRNKTSDEFDESDCDPNSVRSESSDPDEYFQARRHIRDEILSDCIAVASKLHNGLVNIVKLQTASKEVDLTVSGPQDFYFRAFPGHLPLESAGFREATLDLVDCKEELAASDLDIIESEVSLIYCNVLFEYRELILDTEPAVTALQEWCESEHSRVVDNKVLFLVRDIVSGYTGLINTCDGVAVTTSTFSSSELA
ncbi:hypothetical protein LTS10_002072 [Elasticomyces elasticus]|nr:hypothetical protein LTS10_002072 [Elasticomyces elasticus]